MGKLTRASQKVRNTPTAEQMDDLAKASRKAAEILQEFNSSHPSVLGLPNFAAGATPPRAWENQELVEPWGNPGATPLKDTQNLMEYMVDVDLEDLNPPVRPNPFKVGMEQRASYREWQLANPVIHPNSSPGFPSTNGS